MTLRDDLVLSWALYDLGTVDPRVLIRWAQRFCEDEAGDEHDAAVVRLAMMSPQIPRDVVESAFNDAVAAVGEDFPDDEETWRAFGRSIVNAMLTEQITPRDATKVLARLAKERDELANWIAVEASFALVPSGAVSLQDADTEAHVEAVALLELLDAELN